MAKFSHHIPAAEVRAIRLRHGLNVTEFAALCGVSRQSVHGWESGRQGMIGATAQLLRMLAMVGVAK